MKAIYKTNLIINQHRHSVNKEFYDTLKAGDYVEMHYSIYSETLLEIKTNQRKN
jgi:hypothetical protein